MFGDLKKHSFNPESMLLRHFISLSQLTLAVPSGIRARADFPARAAIRGWYILEW
jgi:hypothetical protein